MQKIIMNFFKALKYTYLEYKENLKLILLFSLLFLFSLIVLFLVPTPTYLSSGALFLRIGSLPLLQLFEILIISIFFIISIFLFAEATTLLNILIKEKRTLNKTPFEIIKKSSSYVFQLFFVYFFFFLVSILLAIYLYDFYLNNILYPLILFFIYLTIFFFPQALIIDENNIFQAIFTSINTSLKRIKTIFSFLIFASLLLLGLASILFLLFPPIIAKYILLFLSSVFILPFLTILQIEIYMEKYPLSP